VGRSWIAALVATAAALAVVPSAHAYAHATFTASPAAGPIGTMFIFDAAGSTGVHFLWDLDGDGTYETDSGASQQATKAYTGAGTVIVGLQVFDADGSVDHTNVPVTVTAPSEPPPEQDDVTAPVISNARIAPMAFRLGPKATPLNGHISRARRGARLSWTLSEGANLSIKIQRCASKRRCKPHTTVTMHRTVAAGTRSLAFTGRIELRKLSPGPYRFVLDATDLSGNFSDTVYVPFVILPG
jgi:PKD repeat protein